MSGLIGYALLMAGSAMTAGARIDVLTADGVGPAARDEAPHAAAVGSGRRGGAAPAPTGRRRAGGTTGDTTRPRKLVVVVSKKSPVKSLRLDDLRRMFLRQKTEWSHGGRITVFERSVEHPIRQRFSLWLFKKKPSELRAYWMNLMLTRGLKPPKVLRSTKLVKQYLRRVKGGIGYMYEDELDDTVKVVRILDQNGR